MSKLTEEQKKNHTVHSCPVCKGKHYLFDCGFEFKDNDLIRTVKCADCGAKFNEVYRLIRIEDYDE